MKNDNVYLSQIIDSIEKINNFINGINYQQFTSDQKTQSAVILQLTLIGELTKKISQETKSQINLPWKQISGFRDRAIHDYYQIDIEIVWKTIEEDLLTLEKEIRKHLPPTPTSTK